MANRLWTNLEREFVRKNVEVLTDEEGAKKLGEISGRKITVHAYRKQRQMMGIKKKPGRGICEILTDSSKLGEAVFVAAKRPDEILKGQEDGEI